MTCYPCRVRRLIAVMSTLWVACC